MKQTENEVKAAMQLRYGLSTAEQQQHALHQGLQQMQRWYESK